METSPLLELPMTPNLSALVALFYQHPEELGVFTPAARESVPEPYAHLLAHEHHMTVTVEAFHKSLVDVRVRQKVVNDTHYAREILLARQSDGVVVQYGIMRVTLDHLSPRVQAAIKAEGTPLGRILIQHDVLRSIHLSALWHVVPGPALREMFSWPTGPDAPAATYGRTAMINCNHEPAIELLEIVTPAS